MKTEKRMKKLEEEAVRSFRHLPSSLDLNLLCLVPELDLASRRRSGFRVDVLVCYLCCDYTD